MNKVTSALSSAQQYWLLAAVSLAVLSAILLPLNLLTLQPLHHDEALYATWALTIASGDDPWLTDTPIDKPPLYLYIVAGALHLLGHSATATRIPSLLATALSVLLTFWLGKKLYCNAVGVVAAWLVALSPYTLLFAPTTFTDPLLVTLILAGCAAAVHNRAGWAGFFLALAVATKQQGIFFVPLPAALLILINIRQPTSSFANSTHRALRTTHHIYRRLLTCLAAFILTLLPFLIWDFTRNQPSGFFEQSVLNYGGLTIDLVNFAERWVGFIDLLYYGAASSIINTIFLAGLPLLLLYGLWQIVRNRQVESNLRKNFLLPALADWLFALFILAFLVAHSLLSFQVWDRYLLGLIPFLALLLARILLLPWLLLRNQWPVVYARWSLLPDLLITLGIILLLILTLTAPVQNAINARYPIGSNSRALRGIEQITAYLQGNVGANNTFYHHWLGTHWRFYLWDYPYDLQYWDTPKELAERAEPGQFLAYPTWRSDTEMRLALFEANLTLREIIRAYNPAGNPSIILYQIESIP